MVDIAVDPVDELLAGEMYVAVRVGETQKLSRLRPGQVYKFPQAGDRRFGKIELFRRVGACTVELDPLVSGGSRDLSISCDNGGPENNVFLRVAVTHQPDKLNQITAAKEESAARREQALCSAREYLSSHSLEVRLSDAMQAVLRMRPEDPAEFIAKRLQSYPDGRVKLPPLDRKPESPSHQPPHPELAAPPTPHRPEPLAPLPVPAQTQALPSPSLPLSPPCLRVDPPMEVPGAAVAAQPPAAVHAPCAATLSKPDDTCPVDDELKMASTAVFDDAAMRANWPWPVYQRFKEAVVSGAPTSTEDQKVIAQALFRWARGLGAACFAHWFFPVRGGGGASGGALGALKMDTLIDLDWTSPEANKPFGGTLPFERLFVGETDGSSFPNGGLRATHTAAAFTTWDRSSPCFVLDGVLRVPCAFVTHLGAAIDDKTPLLRSNDAVNRQGLRLLKALRIATDARAVHSFLGWEQEFFVIKAEHYLKRPDLVACGRTLIGRLPGRHQQGELNYFAPPPPTVELLMRNIQAVMLRTGVAMAVMHNEVAPAQHEMSPVYCHATFSSDSNVLFMEVASREAARLGLHVLFHEKPFAGINGSGKHNNWSLGTDTGLNMFHPGKTDEARELFVAAVACLAYGLRQHNEVVRCAVAHAGNDHRLGAQEAPPAIVSLYPGTGFEAHVDSIIAGGPLLGYRADRTFVDPRSSAAMPVPTGVEDRNRTAPFPFCGNRFEFRAVGSSQNCSFPIAICNTIMASGMAHVAGLIESGMSRRDAVASVFKQHREVIFTGNGYSKEWPLEAKRRGLPNLQTTPLAAVTFNSPKAKALFRDLGIFSEEECDARAEVMLESYVTTVSIEAQTLIGMVETGILPACTADLAAYAVLPILAASRPAVYAAVKAETDKLKDLVERMPKGVAEKAGYLCDTVKPQMLAVRTAVDKAEGLMDKDLYPYPTYETLLYSHHSEPAPQDPRVAAFLQDEILPFLDSRGIELPFVPAKQDPAEVLYQCYVDCLLEEAEALCEAAACAAATLVAMAPAAGGRHGVLGRSLREEAELLEAVAVSRPQAVTEQAWFLFDNALPKMGAVRDLLQETEARHEGRQAQAEDGWLGMRGGYGQL